MTVQRWVAAATLCLFALPHAIGDEVTDGQLTVRAEMPAEVRVGQSFQFDLVVTNNSDNVTYHDVKVRQRPGDGLTLDSVEGPEQPSDKKTNGTKTQKNVVSLARLSPGQSQTFTVSATADGEGDLRNCLEVVSYRPSICLTTRAVKPEIQLTKSAPKRANLCNEIELTYTLKNTGSGDIASFTVTDALGDGVTAINGDEKLSFKRDGLKAGEERTFTAKVFATDTGQFGSRAKVTTGDTNLDASSEKTTTNVIAANLDVEVTGTKQLLAGQNAKFMARVTNTGNAPARNVAIDVNIPAAATLVSISDVEMTQSESNASNASASADNTKEPTMANNQAEGSSSKNAVKMEMDSEALTAVNLKPGQSAEFEYIVDPEGLTEVPTKVVALYICDIESSEADAEALKVADKARASAMARSTVVRLPALQLVALDSTDPVAIGGETTYAIRVTNEGNAKDTNVQIKAELPSGLVFSSASGPVEFNQSGQSVEFNPIKELSAGQSAEFKVVAKNDGSNEGNVAFKIDLDSDSRKNTIEEEEPTTLFKSK